MRRLGLKGWLILTLAVIIVAFLAACNDPNEPKMQCRPLPVAPWETCKPVPKACTWQAVAGIVQDNAGRDTADTIPVWACWPNAR